MPLTDGKHRWADAGSIDDQAGAAMLTAPPPAFHEAIVLVSEGGGALSFPPAQLSEIECDAPVTTRSGSTMPA